MTNPKVDKLLLILLASLSRSPEVLVFFCLSEPARSTKFSLDTFFVNTFKIILGKKNLLDYFQLEFQL